MPDGQETFDAAQTESFDGGMPLLGGLGGMLPANSLPQALPDGTVPDVTGLPGGGLTVLAPASPVTSAPAAAVAAPVRASFPPVIAACPAPESEAWPRVTAHPPAPESRSPTGGATELPGSRAA
jgi:hypothetical protein